MTEEELVLYETPAPRVVRISLDRPEVRNAQNTRLLYQLNAAFDRAAQDDAVHVIILAANGPHFSSGHDLAEIGSGAAHENIRAERTVGTWCGFGCAGAEAQMAYEREAYFGLSERWRNLPKPTIAQVQGKVITGGLMLVWPCDLIIASTDATFQDTAVGLGVCGIEFFNHPYELGVRKAKEFLFRSNVLTAADAHAAGMINHVVERDALEAFTLSIAQEIAALCPETGQGSRQCRAGRRRPGHGSAIRLRLSPADTRSQHARARDAHGPYEPDAKQEE